MKNILLLIIILNMSCQKRLVNISVENPLEEDRTEELVEIDLRMLPKTFSKKPFILTNALKEEITYQISFDNKLLFQPKVKAGQKQHFALKIGKPSEFKKLVYARYISERKDDFAWENDRVAFRLYGPALLPVDGPSNGIDLWYKQTSDLIIDKWYKNDIAGEASYHQNHGEGLDDYKVGRSLGGGAMAPWQNQQLILNQNYTHYELLENGPLRATFKLEYPPLIIQGKETAESRTISLDAGSQLSKITQTYQVDTSFQVAAGIVKRPNSQPATLSADSTYIIYSEPATTQSSGVYIAIVNTQKWLNNTENQYKTTTGQSYSHSLGITLYQPNQPVTYYTGYGWNKFGFSDKAAFEKYLENFVKNTNTPLKIILH